MLLLAWTAPEPFAMPISSMAGAVWLMQGLLERAGHDRSGGGAARISAQ